MEGHIWIESEGINKGTTITFIVKLGICGDPDSSGHQTAGRGQTYGGSGHLTGYRTFVKENDELRFANRRYQRSV